MRLGIISIEKFFDSEDAYRKYEEFEVTDYRWLPNHQLEFVIKGSSHYSKLEDNQEIVLFK